MCKLFITHTDRGNNSISKNLWPFPKNLRFPPTQPVSLPNVLHLRVQSWHWDGFHNPANFQAQWNCYCRLSRTKAMPVKMLPDVKGDKYSVYLDRMSCKYLSKTHSSTPVINHKLTQRKIRGKWQVDTNIIQTLKHCDIITGCSNFVQCPADFEDFKCKRKKLNCK